MRFSRAASLAFAALLSLAACSAPPTPQQVRHASERTQLARLQNAYSGTIVGFDFHGTTVDVSVDLNQLYSISEDNENALKAATLRAWRSAWLQTHPHQHAALTVRFIDFRGNLESARSVKV